MIPGQACESWYAKDEGDINKALEAFQKCHDAYYEYKKAIADIDRQSETTKEFNDQVSNIADTYAVISISV